jgi:hypothetical protein
MTNRVRGHLFSQKEQRGYHRLSAYTLNTQTEALENAFPTFPTRCSSSFAYLV